MYRREFRELFRLAAPLAAAQAGTQLMSLVDIAVLGRLGATELASAGLANAIFFAISIIGMGIVYGVDPLISQARGAGDPLRARFVLWQGIWLALVVTVVLTIPMLLAPLALRPFGVQAELIAPSTTYLYIRVIGLAPFLVFLVMRAYLQAFAVTRPMLVAMISANIFNVIADIVLVFGWGPIPAMGIAGAAIATVLGQLLQLGILLAAVKALKPGQHVDHRWSSRDVKYAFRVGLPIGLQLGAEIGIFALVGLLAGRIGTVYLAAHQLVIGLAAFTYTVALGVSSAGSVRVGLGVGARDIAATRAAGHVAFLGGTGIMLIPALAFMFFPVPLARLISNQPHVIAAAMPLFFVAAYFQLSDGMQAVGSGVLRGAGDTRYAFIANLIGHWFVGLPIALYLGFGQDMGIVGLWWGLCAGLTVVAALLLVRFERMSKTEIVPLGG